MLYTCSQIPLLQFLCMLFYPETNKKLYITRLHVFSLENTVWSEMQVLCITKLRISIASPEGARLCKYIDSVFTN